MARDILDLSNVDGADSDYPYGRVRDISTPGAQDGTQVNEKMVGDVLQFFNKLMDEGNITPNGLPDNTTNGFQFFQGLEGLSPYIKFRGLSLYESPGDITTVLISSTYYYWSPLSIVNELSLSGSKADDIVSFGTEHAIGTTLRFYFEPSTGSITITLNSTNAGIYPVIRKSGVTTANTSYTIVFGQEFTATRYNYGWVINEDTDT